MTNVITEHEGLKYYHIIMTEKEARDLANDLYDQVYLDKSNALYSLHEAIAQAKDET
jgi:hypothetical protein